MQCLVPSQLGNNIVAFYELIVIYHSEMIQLGEVAEKQSLSKLYSNYPPHASTPPQEEEVVLPSQMRSYGLGITVLITLQTLSPM